MRPTFDAQDAHMLKERLALWNQRPGPRIGDFIRAPHGDLHRVTHVWPDGVQTAPAQHGSYYLGDGYVSYSGSLDPTIPLDQLVPTEEIMDGRVWFFHHDWHTRDHGVFAVIPCRVFHLSIVRSRA